MPSIELISVDQPEPSALPELPFAIRAERSLRSHRAPSRFQLDFDQLRDCIYHLGGAFCDAPDYAGPFFAYELLSSASADALPSDFLEFAPEVVPAVTDLLRLLLAASPSGCVIFTSDWQAGPDGEERYGPITEQAFWERHSAKKLRLNVLYAIHAHT